MPEITLRNITKRWGKFYGVDHLNLDIADNSFITLLGPSGCGKTTILRMIAGLETPTTGQIKIGDKVVFDSEAGINIPANKRKVGFLFQNYALFPNMTVSQNIQCGIRTGSRAEKQRQASEQLRRFRLEGLEKKYPAQLSGGEQQRVSIARALAKNPKILLCDEPTGALDYKTGKTILQLLQDTCRNTGRTVIVITHNQALTAMADRVIRIKNGTVLSNETNPDPTPVERIEW